MCVCVCVCVCVRVCVCVCVCVAKNILFRDLFYCILARRVENIVIIGSCNLSFRNALSVISWYVTVFSLLLLH